MDAQRPGRQAQGAARRTARATPRETPRPRCATTTWASPRGTSTVKTKSRLTHTSGLPATTGTTALRIPVECASRYRIRRPHPHPRRRPHRRRRPDARPGSGIARGKARSSIAAGFFVSLFLLRHRPKRCVLWLTASSRASGYLARSCADFSRACSGGGHDNEHRGGRSIRRTVVAPRCKPARASSRAMRREPRAGLWTFSSRTT